MILCRMSRIVTLVVPFLVGSSTTAVTAAIIQYHFSGTVGDIADEGGVLTGIVQLGDLYSATWKLESSVPDLDPNLYRGKFDAYSAVLGLPTVTVATAGFLQVTDHPSGDSLYFSSSAPAVAAFSLSLNDASGMALSSPSIPTIDL